MPNIIALDPGGSTGYALYKDGEWFSRTFGPDEHHEDLYIQLSIDESAYNLNALVCESFEFRQRVGGKDETARANINLMSREYIGVAKLFAAEFEVPFVLQSAGQAKPFVTDDKLKIMGLWVPGRKHEMDARRHLVYYLVTALKRYDLIESWKGLT